MTGKEIAAQENYHLKIRNDNKVHLKRNSPWFTQVQTQLGVTRYSWCDFVFTHKTPNITVERISFDHEIFDTKLKKRSTIL